MIPKVGSFSNSEVHWAMSTKALRLTFSWVVLWKWSTQFRPWLWHIWHTRSVIIFSNPWVKARDASSLCNTTPQFLDSDSASESAYSCTFGLRWARRFSTAATTLRALWMSVSFMIRDRLLHAPLFSLVLNFVTQVQYQFPVFPSKVLVRCFICN